MTGERPESGAHEAGITRLLCEWQGGDAEAAARLVPLIYPELRRMAAAMLGSRAGQTHQPTTLIHEVWLRLAAQDRARWLDRKQFFAVAARMIQRILVDHARRRRAAKRGGAARRVPLAETRDLARERPDLLVALDDALERLEECMPDQAAVVRYRFFAGLELEQIAELLQCSVATVKRRWQLARAWLFHELRALD